MPQKTRYTQFVRNLSQDAALMIFLLVLLTVYRAAFIVAFKDTLMADTTGKDIALALWYGLRLSLKTAGACVLPCFLLGTAVQGLWIKWPAEKIRFVWGGILMLVFAILFQTRLPYYQEFQNAFSPFIFNTFHDDVSAIVSTAISQYNAVWRTIWGLLCAAVSYGLLWAWLKWVPAWTKPLLRIRRKTVFVIAFCVLLVPGAVFIRYGGAFSYKHSIYWKNAARMSQHLLNEAILDDVQALYKASRIFKRLKKQAHSVTVEEVRAAAARLLGTPDYTADTLLPVLERKSGGAVLNKPRHIFVIIGETYMLWPLLDAYKDYPIAEGMRELIRREDAVFLPYFMPAFNGTMFGVTSVLLGLPEMNLFTAHRPTAQQPFETSLAVQLAKQGYVTRFFYGGFPSWENVGPFMEKQGVQKGYYYADFGAEGSVWGVPDKALLQGIGQYVTQEPSLNIILTSSNHPPYIVDMTQEPDLLSAQQWRERLPEDVSKDKQMIERLQHFAYADKYLAEFVREMLKKYPESLFIITGDHADRWTLRPNPSLYERFAVPLVVIGKGVSKRMLDAEAAGSHLNIVPTVLELVLPKGTTYYALGSSVLRGEKAGLHALYSITRREITDLASGNTELLPGASPLPPETTAALAQRLKDEQTIASWRILHGAELTK